ncbi:KAP family P-loop NTPase fold protein [Aeromonas oralensis]|uniref:KAP family P-loop NTPase fold protein n=1 Tax=Aeromonas oralensis TaxID=3415010 RepID=UPI003D491A14
MKSNDLYGFASDRPITKIEDDLLDRSKFSSSLANAIASWHGNDSLVVALHGDWGSGKSSIKNMALSQLERISKDKPSIIEFSPWEWAAQEKITASFFQEISKSINRKDKSQLGKKLSETLSKYGRYLDTGETLVSGISAALPTLFILSTAIGIGGNLLDKNGASDISTIMLCILGAWAAVLKWGKEFIYKLTGNTEESAKNKEQSLFEIREELTSLLLEKKTPLIIVMDDLDRLTSSQLRMVFQLIKANLEFPNVVFLLLFQRDIVENKISEDKQIGRDYLEKIIQVPFDIPKIESTTLHDLLFSKLDEIISKDDSATKMFDKYRWGNIFYGSINKYFENLRAIYRYTSTLSFHFTLLKGKKAFEVNPVDLMAIECLRVFEPEIYNEISRAKDVLTKNAAGQYEKKDNPTDAFIKQILGLTTPDKRSYIEKLIVELFPNIQWAVGKSYYSSDYNNIWLKDMRVCHPSNFDKYFQFTLPSKELSNSELQEMIELTNDADKFSAFILSLQDRGILKNALAQFEAFTDEIPLGNARTYIKGILDVGDLIDHKTTGFTLFSSNIHAARLVIWFLKRINTLEERGKILLGCFSSSNGMSIVEHVLQDDENRRERSDVDQLLADSEFQQLKDLFVQKLDDLSIQHPEQLLANEHLHSFLYRWVRWGNERKIKSWLNNQIQDVNGCINLLKRFVAKTTIANQNTAPIHKKTINLDEIEKFVEITAIQEKLQSINETILDIEAREVLIAFKKAIENRDKILATN